MKTSRSFVGIAAAILLAGVFSGCAKTKDSPLPESTAATTIKGITALVPHSELIEFVKPQLLKQGIEVVLASTAADGTTNEKTAVGEVDFNFFQHEPYLQEWNESNGFHLVNAGAIHREPLTAYSDQYVHINDLPEHVVAAVPNEGIDEYRALLILEENGFIRLNEDAALSLGASTADIKEYLRPIEIVELDSTQIIPTKDDFDLFITNTNKALEAKITSNILCSEGSQSPYVNIIAVDEKQKDNPAILALVKALKSEETKDFILENYNGAVIPVTED